MKKFTYPFILISFFAVSCGSALPHILGKKTPHEKYGDRLADTGLIQTPEGRLWMAASQKAVADPLEVAVPYKLEGYFHPDKPRALGLSFSARQGELITFKLERNAGLMIYADLFKGNGTSTAHQFSAETTDSSFVFHVTETGTYILRLQPEISSAGSYTLAIQSGPSLGFPVSGTKARVGSFWGDSRDGGKRDHEGIDIFAPKRTPVVAIADGYISSVRDGGLGGKTVNLRPVGANYSLYYAHLDEQLVREGEFVKKGKVLGLVGNTGNAKTTPPHLHFGIYTAGGAVDPFPFVNQRLKSIPAVPDRALNSSLKLTRSQKGKGGKTIPVNTLLTPLAATPKGYIAESEEGEIWVIPFSNARPAGIPVQKEVTARQPRKEKQS